MTLGPRRGAVVTRTVCFFLLCVCLVQSYKLSRVLRFVSRQQRPSIPFHKEPPLLLAGHRSRWRSLFSSSSEDQPLTVEQAQDLLRKARQLKAEALAMEQALESRRSREGRLKESEDDALLNRLFRRPMTKDSVVTILREERWSVDQTTRVLELLYERRKRALVVDADGAVLGVDMEQAATNTTIDQQVKLLLEAAKVLDEETGRFASARWSGRAVKSLESRWKELRRNDEKETERQLAIAMLPKYQNVTDLYLRQTLGIVEDDEARDFNLTRVLERVSLIPMWVPSSIIKYLVASRATVLEEDVKTIKERVLPGTGFFCTSSDSIPSAAVFRGNVRVPVEDPREQRNVTAVVFAEINRRLQVEGIADRVQVFFLPDPEWRPGRDERETKPRPVLLAVSKLVVPDDRMMKQSLASIIIKRASFPLTCVATFLYSVTCYALNPSFFDRVVNRFDAKKLLSCLPIFFGVLGVQVFHELAHILVGRRHNIKFGTPTPIPSAEFGTFGCITPLRSFPPNRKAMLDFALSGPVAALCLSLLLMTVGTLRTVSASASTISSFPFVPVSVLKSSFISGFILTLLAPKTMKLPLSQPVPISPLFMIGFAGLISSSLNLLPVFRLDGGRACNAAMGPRTGAIASAWTLLLLFSSAFTDLSSSALEWCLIIVFFQRRAEIPTRDDVTEVDDVRLGAWITSLATALLALAPFPGGLGFL